MRVLNSSFYPSPMEARRCPLLSPIYQRQPCSTTRVILGRQRSGMRPRICRLPSHLGKPPWPSACLHLDSLRWTDLCPPPPSPSTPPPSPDSLPLFPLKLCLQDVSGQRAGFWSYRLGCAALTGGGAVGRVSFDLLLQASFPPLTLGGGGGYR